MSYYNLPMIELIHHLEGVYSQKSQLQDTMTFIGLAPGRRRNEKSEKWISLVFTFEKASLYSVHANDPIETIRMKTFKVWQGFRLNLVNCRKMIFFLFFLQRDQFFEVVNTVAQFDLTLKTFLIHLDSLLLHKGLKIETSISDLMEASYKSSVLHARLNWYLGISVQPYLLIFSCKPRVFTQVFWFN